MAGADGEIAEAERYGLGWTYAEWVFYDADDSASVTETEWLTGQIGVTRFAEDVFDAYFTS